MKKRADKRSKRTWFRVGVWGAVASLLVLSIGWLFPAQAATPSWWDCDYGYRQKLTVTASAAVPVDYSTTLTFDHAALVSAGKSEADGDDIRIKYWNGSGWVALDRWLDPDSTWNNSATKIWFKVQAAIVASDGNYYLYYGNTLAVNPPDIPQNIFFFYDGYESNDFSAWDVVGAGAGDSNTVVTSPVHTGTYAAKAEVDNSSGSYARVENNITGQGGFHSTIWVYLPVGYTEEDDITFIQYYTGGWTTKVATVAVRGNEPTDPDRMKLLLGIHTDPQIWYFGSTLLTKGEWHRVEMKVIVDSTNGRVEVWLDGNKEIDLSNKDTGTGDIDHNLANITWRNSETNGEIMYFDNSFDRVWVDPEPTTSLGGEELNDCGAGDPPLCTWPYRRQLTFDNTFSGNATLTDFPVLVVLNSSRIDYGKTQDAGEDLRFYDADGTTKLSHEIEEWNESGNSYVWVKVPQIDGASSTDHIFMYYGHATVADGQDAEAVWSNGFEAVWHLHNDFQDSTSNNHDGTNNGSTDIPDGIAADGQSFDGNNDYIDTNFTSDYGASQNFTWEGWFNVNNINGSDDILGIEDRFCTDPPGCTTYAGDRSEIRLAVRNPSGPAPVSQYDTHIRPDSGTNYPGTPAISPSSGNWHYAVLLRGGGTGRLYLDGSEVDNGPVSTNALTFPRTPNTLLIGAQWETDVGGSAKRNWMDGKLDEIRTSTTNRGAGWIKATYNTIKDTFITYASEETVGTSVGYFTPDAAAAGMSVPVTFVGNICAVPVVTTSSSDIVVGPSILTDSSGNVVTQNGTAISTMFFLKPDARPATGITVSFDTIALTQTFDIVIPTPDPNVTSGTGTLSGRSKRGTAVLGGLTVASGATLKISTGDTDGATAGNQGYLPPTILVKGDVDISGTLDLSGQDGTDAAADCVGGDGGAGAPGGGGGGGGGVTEPGCGGGGGSTDLGPLHDTYVYKNDETANGSETIIKIKKSSYSAGSVRQGFIKFDTSSITDTITSATLKLNVIAVSSWPDADTLEINEYTDNSWDENTVWSDRPPASEIGATLGTVATPVDPDPTLLTIDVTAYVLARRGGGNDVISFTTQMANNTNGGARISTREGTVPPVLTIEAGSGGGGAPAAVGGSGYSGGGGGGAKGSGSGAAGGDGTNAAGAAASGTSGGSGGVSLAGSTGGAGGMPNNETTAGDGGSGGTGDPVGTGGGAGGPFDDGAPAGQGGGGGGASGGSPGGGGGGGFATAGGRGPDLPDAGFGGNVSGNAQLVPLAGGSGGAGGAPNKTTSTIGGGGGGAGGAVRIYATGSVSITGTFTADGGDGGAGYNAGAEGSAGGGGGSGGATLIQSGDVTASGTFTTAGGTAGTGGEANAAGGAGGDGRIRIDGLASGSVPGTAGSKFIGPAINKLVSTTVTGRADGGSSITLYVYDETGAQVTGSPYTTSASGSTGSVGTWTATGVTFPTGEAYLAVKQTSGSVQVFGPGRGTQGIHLINWREVY